MKITGVPNPHTYSLTTYAHMYTYVYRQTVAAKLTKRIQTQRDNSLGTEYINQFLAYGNWKNLLILFFDSGKRLKLFAKLENTEHLLDAQVISK